ncbi:hypothetical protein FF011L_18310 [Roseimaritima multifibrata]|uniref:Uncharacterized protein n=1 Tax=Roseimaritima multifibrata TaxID=1930274 RepID=A0A517ME16_9BACT|nr:hypothetical protein FF011L_18310 [Roseimaritima multifibrata]
MAAGVGAFAYSNTTFFNWGLPASDATIWASVSGQAIALVLLRAVGASETCCVGFAFGEVQVVVDHDAC